MRAGWQAVDLGEGGERARIETLPLLGQAGVRIGERYIELGDERRAELVKALHEYGKRGRVEIPRDPAQCARGLARLRAYFEQMEVEFFRRVAQKTSNEMMQAKVIAILKHKLVAKL